MPKGNSTLSRLIALALSLFAPRRWTSLSEAVEQKGSLDSLVALLRDGSIAARHGGLYVNGRLSRPADSIDASWWNHVHVFNVAADRIVFELDWFTATAIEVEVERAALNALSSRRSSGEGARPSMIGTARRDTSTPMSLNMGRSPTGHASRNCSRRTLLTCAKNLPRGKVFTDGCVRRRSRHGCPK